MQRFKNILVGVDLSSGDRIAAPELSEATREAIRQALWLGEHLGCMVTFSAALDIGAHAEELIAADINHLVHSVDDQAFEILRGIHQQAIDAGVNNRVHVAHGHPWETIVRKVIRDKHDLVLVGTRNHTLMDKMLFGTTGIKLLRYCPCPVWITKPGFHDREIINVLVADDLRDVGYQCLRIAIGGGQLFPTRTRVLHVVEELPPAGSSEQESQQLLQEMCAFAEKSLQDRLATTDYRTLQHGVLTHVEPGRADDVIVRMIEEHSIDVLVMGTAGRSGLSGFFFGNTVEQMLPRINCSLIAVKPDDFRSPITVG